LVVVVLATAVMWFETLRVWKQKP